MLARPTDTWDLDQVDYLDQLLAGLPTPEPEYRQMQPDEQDVVRALDRHLRARGKSRDRSRTDLDGAIGHLLNARGIPRRHAPRQDLDELLLHAIAGH